jgi:hypothetical protein
LGFYHRVTEFTEEDLWVGVNTKKQEFIARDIAYGGMTKQSYPNRLSLTGCLGSLLPRIKVYFYTGLQGSKEDFHEIPILSRIGLGREKYISLRRLYSVPSVTLW